MDEVLDSSCMPSLTLHNFSAEMDEVSYVLPKSPQRAQVGVFLLIHHHCALTGHPGTPSFPPGLQTQQREQTRVLTALTREAPGCVLQSLDLQRKLTCCLGQGSDDKPVAVSRPPQLQPDFPRDGAPSLSPCLRNCGSLFPCDCP